MKKVKSAAGVYLFFASVFATAAAPADREPALVRIRRIALGNARRQSGYWDPQQRDCAGFVRFVYREALGTAARRWRNRAGQWVDYAAADELVGFNFERIGGDPESAHARSGDLLVYYNPRKRAGDAWHLMLLLEPPPGARREFLAVYHTGENPSARNPEPPLKRAWYSDLEKSTVTEWRPRPANGNFLGIYRWKGWDRAWTQSRQ